MAKKKRKKKINSRSKGRRYEQQIANNYRALGYTAERAIQSRGAEASDVIVAELPFWIECKNSARPNIFKALEQARRDRKKGQPIVLHVQKIKGSGSTATEVVVLEREYWFEILEWLKESGARLDLGISKIA